MKKLIAFLLLSLFPVMAHALSWDGQGYAEDVSIDGTEKIFLENPAGTGNNWAKLSTARTYMGAAAWPTVAGIPYWTSGTSWGGAYTLDTNIISGVSASDDTIASAKATDAAIQLKADKANPTFTGGITIAGTDAGGQYFYLFEDTDNGSNYVGIAATGAVTNSQLFSLPAATPSVGGVLVWGTGASQTMSDGTTKTVIPVETLSTQNIATTGTIQGGIVINSDANGMSESEMTAVGLRGTLFIATGAGTWTLPTAVAGMSACLMDSGTAHDLILDVQADDDIQLKGVEDTNGDGITNASGSTTGDFVCVVAISAGHWVTTGIGGTWVAQ